MRRSIVILSAVYALCLATAATTSGNEAGLTCQTSTSNGVQLDGAVTTCQTTTDPEVEIANDKALQEDVLAAGPAPSRRKSRDAKSGPKAAASAPKQRRAESPDALKMLGLPSPRQARTNPNRVKAKRAAAAAERPASAKRAPVEADTAKVEKQSSKESTAQKDSTTNSFQPIELPTAQAFRAAFAAPWKRAPGGDGDMPLKETGISSNGGISDKIKASSSSGHKSQMLQVVGAAPEKRFPSTSSQQGSHEGKSSPPSENKKPSQQENKRRDPPVRERAPEDSSSRPADPAAPAPPQQKQQQVSETPSAAERLGLPNANAEGVDGNDDRHSSSNNSNNSDSSSPMPRRSRRVEQFVRKLQSRKIAVKSPKWLPEGGFLFVG